MNLIYLVCDYSATGEGRTVSVLVTQAYPFEDSPYVKDGLDREARLRKRFTSVFDEFWTIGMEELTKNEFEERYAWTMPEAVYNLINDDHPPGFGWYTQIHFNFS